MLPLHTYRSRCLSVSARGEELVDNLEIAFISSHQQRRPVFLYNVCLVASNAVKSYASHRISHRVNCTHCNSSLIARMLTYKVLSLRVGSGRQQSLDLGDIIVQHCTDQQSPTLFIELL